METTISNTGTCGCGAENARYHSGEPECDNCWQQRKIDGPAARYWVKAIDRLFEDPDTGSTAPDTNDYLLWERWGMREDVEKALYVLTALGHAYGEMVANPYPWAKES